MLGNGRTLLPLWATSYADSVPSSRSSPIDDDTEHNYWHRRGVLRSRNMRMLDTVELKLCIW